VNPLRWRQWWQGLTGAKADPLRIPDALWHSVVQRYPFLSALSAAELHKLRGLSSEFLAHKQFSGAHGLVITDDMALAIAAQACLPVLHLGLHWYGDFRGIVVHPSAMRAHRVVQDEVGLVHHYTEELSGEAMDGGPVTLSWPDAHSPSMLHLMLDFVYLANLLYSPIHASYDLIPVLIQQYYPENYHYLFLF
jgi:Mlc titration factor MtfA (ptsG expression regulator)